MLTTSSSTIKNKILIIDGQLFQNDTFFRGMGRYSYKLLSTLFSNNINFQNNFQEVILLLNNDIPTSKERLILINNISKDLKIKWIKLPFSKTTDPINRFTTHKETLTKYVIDKFPKKEITFAILSNFEVFHSLSVFPELVNCQKILLFFDLIPHLFFKEYLQNNNTYIPEYYSRFKNIFEANQIFTISQTTKNDLTNFLNIDPIKVVNINGALINETKNSLYIQNGHSSKQFFLCPSGDDLRKNNDKIVSAFSIFSKDNGNKYKLIITSKFSDDSKNILYKIRDEINPKADIEFCGNVTDELLNSFYHNCLAVVFLPTYEGLGLPILEAVNHHKCVIASDIPVFKEISPNAFYFCNPKDIPSIILAFNKCILSKLPDQAKYKIIIDKYTWNNTSKIICDSINISSKHTYQKKIKIALVGPSLTGYSAIAKYCEDIYPSLLEKADVDYFYDDGLTNKKFRESYLPFVTGYYKIKDLNQETYKKYDYFIYNLGNSEYHINIYKKACIYPGLVVLHDGTLSGMFNFALQNNLIENKRYDLEKSLDKDMDSKFLTSILNSSLATIVHSEFNEQYVNHKTVFLIKTIKSDLPTTYSVNYKKTFTPIVISLAGIISTVKGTDLFIDIIKKIYSKYKNKVKFQIFGYDFNSESNLLKEQLSKYPCEITSNLSDLEYQEKLKNTNILVNFRSQYNGETSKSCIDAFRHKIVTIVRDIGWFSELPDDTVIKVTNEEQILGVIYKLLENKLELINRGEKSKLLIDNSYNSKIYVESIMHAITSIDKNNKNMIIRNNILSSNLLNNTKLLTYLNEEQ